MSQIVYIKTACERCSGHIEYPSQLVGHSIECPHCRETITLPSGPPIPPQSTPSPPLIPSSARRTPPGSRHGIFYYVFWGTVSLSAALGILIVGFFFLTGAGAAFLKALSHHSSTVQSTTTKAITQNLPALTETENMPALTQAKNLPAPTKAEIKQARRLITALSSRVDGIERITWYSPEPDDNYKTAVYLYIGKKKAGKPLLRWKIRYYGDNWLFIQRFRVKIDGGEPVTVLPTNEIKCENSGLVVWETFDEAASDYAHVLNQMLAGDKTYLGMEGSKGRKDIELGPEQLQKMRDVLLVFRYLGGTWPAAVSDTPKPETKTAP